MAIDNGSIDRKIQAAQASITSLSIFTALSIAMIALLLSQSPVEVGYNYKIISSGFLSFAVVLFFISLEFFILGIYQSEHIDWFGLLGSCLYATGASCLIISISLALAVFGVEVLSWLFLSVAFLGYLAYYILRIKKLGHEKVYSKVRYGFRGVCFLLYVSGFIFLATAGG